MRLRERAALGANPSLFKWSAGPLSSRASTFPLIDVPLELDRFVKNPNVGASANRVPPDASCGAFRGRHALEAGGYDCVTLPLLAPGNSADAAA